MALSFIPLAPQIMKHLLWLPGIDENYFDSWLGVTFTPVMHLAAQAFLPVALLVVILRQQLWGIDVTVNRATVWTLLTLGTVDDVRRRGGRDHARAAPRALRFGRGRGGRDRAGVPAVPRLGAGARRPACLRRLGRLAPAAVRCERPARRGRRPGAGAAGTRRVAGRFDAAGLRRHPLRRPGFPRRGGCDRHRAPGRPRGAARRRRATRRVRCSWPPSPARRSTTGRGRRFASSPP